MDFDTENTTPSRGERWRERMDRVRVRLKRLVPFLTGVSATLLGLLLYNALVPGPQPLTLDQVNNAVAQAMASATPGPAYSSQVYQVIQPSLVLIQSTGVDTEGEAHGGLGSGVLVSEDGMILTALHVVEGAEEIKLTFADGTEATGQVASTQPENDIAVLLADKLPEILVPAVLGNPNAMRIGDEAYAVGNPFGLYGSMSAGVISGFNRSFINPETDEHISGLMQIDSAVNPGNSGGPLLNRSGQVVGIVVGILNPTDDEVFIGIGFAVPITTAGGAAGMPQY